MRGARERRIQREIDGGAIHSDRQLQLPSRKRRGDARGIRAKAATGHVRDGFVYSYAKAEFGSGMGKARNFVRIRVAGRLRPRLRNSECEIALGRERTFGRSDAGARAEWAEQRRANLAARTKSLTKRLLLARASYQE